MSHVNAGTRADVDEYHGLAVKLLNIEGTEAPSGPISRWKAMPRSPSLLSNRVPQNIVGGLSRQEEESLWLVVSESAKGPSWSEWGGLSIDQRLPYMRKAVAHLLEAGQKNIEAIEAKSQYQSNTPPQKRISLDARAMAVFIEHRDWTKKEIAECLRCHEKSLAPNRCPKLAAAITAWKAPIDPDRRQLRGFKDAEGNLEAWEG